MRCGNLHVLTVSVVICLRIRSEILGPLAQLAEQRTFNPWVVGSIPTGPTQVFILRTPFMVGRGVG